MGIGDVKYYRLRAMPWEPSAEHDAVIAGPIGGVLFVRVPPVVLSDPERFRHLRQIGPWTGRSVIIIDHEVELLAVEECEWPVKSEGR